MRDNLKSGRRFLPLLIAATLVLLGFAVLLFVSSPVYRLFWVERWEAWTRESRKVLGWGRPEVSPEEKRIREEVILKKMDEANASQDWKALVPEYPRPKNFEGAAEGEKTKAFRNSPEFKKIENALMDYLKEKEDLLTPESPMPSFREALELPARKDKGTEKIIEGFLKPTEKPSSEKPLEENLQL